MTRRILPRISALAIFTLAAFATFAAPPAKSLAQTTTKKIVKTEDDLPQFNYPIDGTAIALLTSDDATFNVFAAKVGADVDSILDNYDIQDSATLRSLLGVRLELQLLAGNQDKAALETLSQIHNLVDKPDAKLLSGLEVRAMIDARATSGQNSGPAYAQAFVSNYAASLKPLPWAIVRNRIRESKSSAEIVNTNLLKGSVQAEVEPEVAKSHQLSNDLAWALVGARFELKDILPLKVEIVDVLTQEVAANNGQKPDIWADRNITLTDADKLTPVAVAIWDSGSDLSLFPGRVYTAPHPAPGSDPHGLAFDLKGLPTHGVLPRLNILQMEQYPSMVNELKGFFDVQLSINSYEARAFRKQLATMPALQVPGFLEQLEFFSNYAHGTHVAGITARGNPAIRLAVGRVTFDWHRVPLAPSEALSRRIAADDQAYVDWFRSNHIRVVNIGWSEGPEDDEKALEKNDIGKGAAERKAIARKLFAIKRKGLYNAIKSAPDVLFICAAGSAGSNNTSDEMIPASFKLPNLLTVGAVDQAGDETSFTSYGPTVLVDADGYQVESVVPLGYTAHLSGTSMASPHAANLAAKLIALNPNLTPEQTIHLIVAGATASTDGRRHNIDAKRSIDLLHHMQLASR